MNRASRKAAALGCRFGCGAFDADVACLNLASTVSCIHLVLELHRLVCLEAFADVLD